VKRFLVPAIAALALAPILWAQTPPPPDAAKKPRVMAHDSIIVKAGIPTDVLQKESLYDKVFQAAMELKEDTEYDDALLKFQEAERIAETLPGPNQGDSPAL